MNDFWKIVRDGKDSISSIKKDHEEYRGITRPDYMQQLFSDREAYRVERDDCRKRGDMTMARSLNAKIGNCTAKMNKLMQQNLDALIPQNRLAKKP